jgi:serine/threonine-protein kinase
MTSIPITIKDIVASRYRLIGQLGKGSMGVVWAAEDRVNQQVVALKTVLPSHSAKHANKLLSEADVLEQLDHPGVCLILDRGYLEDGRPFYTMPYIKGETFAEFLQHPERKGFIARGINVLKQLTEILHYTHNEGFLHCDVKPANIMLAEGDRVILIDWGTSETRVQSESKTAMRGKSENYTINGTPLYMAPEVIRGEAASPEADLYAIGVMLYELLSGVHPFVHENVFILFHNICFHDIPPLALREGLHQIPEEMADLMYHLLQKTPSQRYMTHRNLWIELDHWYRNLLLRDSPQRPGWFAHPNALPSFNDTQIQF